MLFHHWKLKVMSPLIIETMKTFQQKFQAVRNLASVCLQRASLRARYRGSLMHVLFSTIPAWRSMTLIKCRRLSFVSRLLASSLYTAVFTFCSGFVGISVQSRVTAADLIERLGGYNYVYYSVALVWLRKIVGGLTTNVLQFLENETIINLAISDSADHCFHDYTLGFLLLLKWSMSILQSRTGGIIEIIYF